MREGEFGNLTQNLDDNKSSNFDKLEDFSNDEAPAYITLDKFEKLYPEKVEIIREKIGSRIKAFLEKVDLLKVVDGQNVFDFDNFDMTGFLNTFRKVVSIKEITGTEINVLSINNRVILDVFKELLVVDKEDFNNDSDNLKRRHVVEPPDSAQDLFDFSKLKYYGFDENNGNSFDFKNDEEIRAKNGDIISVFEIKIFQRLFGKLRARRDADGKLLMWSKNENDFVPFNIELLGKHLRIIDSAGKDTVTAGSILSRCSNLFKLGLLNTNDFYINTMGPSGELLRKEFSYNGRGIFQPAINGVRYYVGRENFIHNNEKGEALDSRPSKNIRVVVLDDHCAGILEYEDGDWKLVYTFKLLDNEEIELKREKIKEKNPKLSHNEVTANITVGKSEFDSLLKPWDITEDNPPKQGESQQDYFKRISTVKDYDFISRVGIDFLKKSNLGIHNLSWKEQQWLCSAYYELGTDRNKLFNFAKEYGLDGLRTFLSCESDPKNSKKILEIENSIQDKEFAKKFFSECGLFFSEIQGMTQEIKSSYEKCFSHGFEENRFHTAILEKINGIIFKFTDILQSKDDDNQKNESLQEILEELKDEFSMQLQSIVYFQEIMNELFAGGVDKFIKDQETETDEEGVDKNKILFDRLRERIDEMIFNPDTWKLPDNFKENLENQIVEYKTEIKNPHNKKIYFPVGITSNPERAINYKPIDAIEYLFWANNQGNVDILIAKNLQKYNYGPLYGLNESDSKKKIDEISEMDSLWYDSYISRFNLDNINFLDQDEVEGNENYLKAKTLINEMCEKKPGIQKYFEGIVEPGVLKKAKENNPSTPEQELKSELCKYAKDEVAFTLSLDGIKVGHGKELRYDVMSQFINILDLLEKNREQFTELIFKDNPQGKFISKESIDFHINNSAIALLLDSSGNKEYKNILEKIGEIEEKKLLVEESIQKIKNRLSDLDKGLKKNLGDLEERRTSGEFEPDRIKLIEQKIKEETKSINELGIERKQAILELEEIEKQRDKLEKNKKDILNSDNETKILDAIIRSFQKCGIYSERISKERLSHAYKDLIGDIKQQEWFDESKLLEFFYPKSVTGMSFEISKDEKDEKTGFREWYSSFSIDTQDFGVNANQIIAKEGWDSSAKFFALSHENQIEYFEKVIKPLLVNYYVSISNNREQAKEKFERDFSSCNSMLEAIIFIEQNIVYEANEHLRDMEEDRFGSFSR